MEVTLFTTSRAVVCFLCGLISLSFPANAQQPAPLAKGSKPFLSTAVEARDERNSRELRPTKDGIEKPFYDVPSVVNVPFEVRYDGGNVWVVWQATVYWDDPPTEWKNSRPPDGLREIYAISTGIYRLDGASMPEKSVLTSSGGPMKWDAQAPVPTFVTRPSNSIRPGKPPHKPFATDEWRYAQLRPAQPGWYALWFGQDGDENIWPQRQPNRTTLSGRYHVDIVVARGEREPSKDVVKFLFGQGKRPEGMAEDKFYTASTVEIPFTLRRDGWVFDRLEIRAWSESLKQKRSEHSWGWIKEQEHEVVPAGTDAKLNLKTTTFKETDGQRVVLYTQNHRFTLKFPPTLPDFGFGAVELSGGIEREFNRGSPDYNAEDERKPFNVQWNWDAGTTSNQKDTTGQVMTSLWQHVSRALDPVEEERRHEKERRETFVKEYGEEAAKEWFKLISSPTPGFGPAKGAPPFRYVVYAWPPFKERIRLATDAGSCPLMAYKVGPWEVIAHYKRLKDVEGRVVASTATAGEATVVKETDDFWKWFVPFGFLLGKQLPIAAQAQINATQEAVPLPGLLKARDRLLLALQPDAVNAMGVQAGSVASQSPLAVAASADATAAQVARIQAKLQQVAGQIGEHRKQISKYTDEARAAYDVILAELDKAYQTHGGPGHPELTLWRIDYRKARERVALDIARSSNDPEFLKKALADSAIEGETPDTRVLEAKLHLLGGDAIAGVDALWRAVRVETNHPAARQMLADVEAAFLQRAIEKSQGAIADARKHFYGYLMERGFSDTDIISSKTNRLDWIATRVGVYGEEAWAAFTTGLFGSFSAFYGKPAAEAELLATTERQMTTAFVGLHTMRLLRKKGVTFAEMQKLTSTQMRDKIGMVRSDADAANLGVAVREAMKLPDVKALMAGNREALETGMHQGYWDSKDVSNTWIEWYGDLTSAYNLFTLLLPAAKAGTAGRTSGIMWTRAEAAMVGELQTLGVVKSGTEVVATSLGITRALNAVGATERGKKLTEYLVQLEKYQAGLGTFDTAVWTVGKITGALTFGYLTVTATEHLAGHKAAMLVQAALLFATDTELLVKLLKARNIPPDKIAKLIINDYMPATKVHLKRLAYVEKSTFELEELLTRVKAGNKLSAEDFTILNRYFGSNWRKITPGAVASENAAIAVHAAAESLRNGVDTGALQAAKELKPALQAEAKATTQTLQEQQKVADALNAAAADAAPPPVVQQPATPTRGPPVPDKPLTAKFGVPAEAAAAKPTPLPPKPKPPKPIRSTPEYPPSAQRVLPEEVRAPGNLGGYVIHPPVRSTSRTAEAIQSMHNGQFAVAERKFAQIQDDIRAGLLTEAEEMTMERLHVLRMVANDLQRVTRKTPKPGSSVINTAIPAATVEEVLSKPGMLKPKKTTGAMSTVFEVEGHPDLFVKRIEHKFERWNEKLQKMETVEINILEDVENNLLHEQLARAMGFDVPAMEARIIYDAQGQAIEAYYVMRKVEGRPLASMTAGEIFLYREELARHKALATLIGDFDRKLDNYIITSEGHFVPIDAGMGDARGSRLSREMSKEGYEFAADAPFSIDGVYGRDHWYAKSIAEAPGKEILTEKKTLLRKFLIGEEAMTFQGAEPVVIEIEKMFVNGAKAAEAKQAIRDAYIRMYLPERTKRLASLKGLNAADPAVLAGLEQEAVRSLESKLDQAIEAVETNLKARAPKIRDSMKGLNERNGQPLFETDTTGALELDDDFIIRFTLQHFLNTIPSRKAA